MLAVYQDSDAPPYLDAAARTLLSEGRAAFEEYGLARNAFVADGRDVHVLLWRGTELCAVFGIALQAAGLDVEVHDLGLTVANATVAEVRSVVSSLAGMPPIPSADLAEFVQNLRTAKYDEFVPEALLRRLWGRSRESEAASLRSAAAALIGQSS